METYFQRLLRIAANWNAGLLTDEEYCEQVTFLAAEFCYPSFKRTCGS